MRQPEKAAGVPFDDGPLSRLAAVDRRVVGSDVLHGAIGVVETREPIDVAAVQSRLVDRGVWLRPFGRLLYAMPPFVVAPDELQQVTAAMREVLIAMGQ